MNPPEAERRAALDATALAIEIIDRARSIYGAMEIEGEVGSFPISGMRARRLTGPRLALVGDAGHFFPPIGAQGLNLGLRDVAELAECLEGATADAGAPAALDLYEQRRAADIVSRTMSVDLLNRSLLFDLPPVDFARAVGMVAASSIGPLRRSLMREGILPRGRLPRLMREPGPATKKSGLAKGQAGLRKRWNSADQNL
jgi:2-octaprenyl-6-methoxyphenol hydroxylase